MPLFTRETVRSRSAACLLFTIAALVLLGGPIVGGRAIHAQVPTPTPLPGPQMPVPPRGRTVVASLPACTTDGRITVAPERVVVGGTITATIAVGMTCPEELRARSAVIVVGGIDAEWRADVQAALFVLVDALGDAGRSRVALLYGTDPAGAPHFAALPEERDAVVAAITAHAAQPAGTGAAWADRIEAAAAALATTGPTQRPMLVVIDGARPGGDVGPGLAVLRRTLLDLPDRLGLGLLIDVSPDAWLRGIGQGGAVPDTVALYVRPSALDGLSGVIMDIVVALQAPIGDWVLDFGLPSNFVIERTRIAVAPLWQPSDAFPWQGRAASHALAATGEVVFRAVRPGEVRLGASLTGIRGRAQLTRAALAPSAAICVFPPGLEAACGRLPPDDRGTATPVPALPRPPPTPVRGPQPATPTARPASHVLYLPVARR